MTIYPWYQDTMADVSIKKSEFPFKVSINTLFETYPLHHHDFMELSLVLSGHGFEIVNGRKHTLRPGTVSILLPHHIHEIHRDSDAPLQLYCCMFDMSLLFETAIDSMVGNYMLKTGTQIPSYFQLDAHQATKLQAILDGVSREYEGEDLFQYALVRSRLLQALVLILRSCFPDESDEAGSPADDQVARPETTDKITKIVQYLHLHYRDPINLNMLAEQFRLSRPYISRLFKLQTGQNFTDYVHTLRIHRALSLLATTDMSILDISTDVGFEHSSTFNRVFKKVMGITAQAYRKHKIQAPLEEA